MAWQYTPYTIPLIIAGGFSCLLALYVRMQRRTEEAATLSLLMLAVGVWSVGQALQFANATLAGQIFWDKAHYLGQIAAPLLWLIFALQYSGRRQWVTLRTILLLSLIPMCTVIFIWTNEFHGLIWREYRLERFGSYLVESSSHGPWFPVHVTYAYLLTLVGSLLIFERLIISRSTVYRGQAAALLIFISAPWISSILDLFGVSPFPHLNLTPFVFTITNTFLVWAFLRFRLGDLLPVAHAAVIESMSDGVIVLDEQDRIVEMNDGAQKILGLRQSRVIGYPLADISPSVAEQLGLHAHIVAFQKEVCIGEGDAPRIYDIRFSPLIDKRRRLMSKIVVMRDISERKRAEAELQKHKDSLEETVIRRTAELMDMNERLVAEISQRKQVEGALRDSEEKYKSIVENTSDIIMLTGADGIIRYVSPSCKAILEYEPEELTGGRFSIVHPNDHSVFEEKFAAAFAGEAGFNLHYRVLTRSGAVKWLSHAWSTIMRDDRLQMIVSSVRDVTEQKAFEEALKRSEERYRALIENQLNSICVNQDGVLKFVNKRFVEQSGYTEEELSNMPFERLVYPADRALIGEVIQRRLSGEDPTGRYEFRATTKNGSTLWMESFGAKIDFQGKPALLVSLNDITDRKRAEEALKESEQRYRTLIEEAKDIIYTIDLKTSRLHSANSFAEDALGYKREDILGTDYLNMTHPEDHERLVAALRSRINGEERIPNFPVRLKKADGSFLDVEQNGAVIYDDEGKPALYLGVARDVTKRKLMEEELRRSEERYRQILNSSHDIVVVTDADEKVHFVNRAYFDYITQPPEDLKGGDIFAFVHPDDRPMVKEWFAQVISGESMLNAQYRIIDERGKVKWLESNANPIQWPGVDNAVVNISRDITDRKAAEEALKESEERYRTLVDNSFTGILVIQDGKFQFANDRLCEMSGFTREEIVGMQFSDKVHPEDRERMKQVVAERLRNPGARGHSQFRCIVKNGDVLWVETFGAGIQFQGRPALLINLLDITERKQMEEALRESEQKFRSLVEVTSDWVWETDTDGNFTYSSPKVKDLLGYEPEEVIGRSAFDFMIPQEAEEMPERAWRGGSFAGVEKSNMRKDGRVVVLESSGVPFFDLSDRIIGYRGIDRDITDRKRADEALRISEERYRSIFEEAPDIFYILDLDTLLITDANKYALESLGYGSEVIGKMHVSRIVHPDDFEPAVSWMRAVVKGKDWMPDFPLRILTATRDVRYIEQRGVVLRDKGRPAYFLGLAHDVTKRRMHEEMIKKRNEKLAALYEVAGAANTSLDLDRVLALVMNVVLRLTNSDACCIFKYDEMAKSLACLAASGLDDEFVQALRPVPVGVGLHGHVAAARSPLNLHNLPKHSLPKGRPHLSQLGFESALILPLMAREKLLGTLSVARRPGKPYDSEELDLMSAIANQLVAAMENADLYSQILQREAHLQSILQTSLDGIAVTSEDQRVVYRNHALSTMYGYSDDDDVSDTNTMSYFAPESYPILEEVRAILKQCKTIDRTLEFKGKRKDGTLFDAEMRIGFFIENGNRFDVSIIRDVTERKRIEFQLLQSSKLAAIGELAAGVAHEINNPLSAIDVQAGLIRDVLSDERPLLDEHLLRQLELYLDTIEEQVRRCNSVTNNLLTFSRYPASKKEEFDINKLLRRTMEFMTHVSEKKPKLKMVLDERLPAFYGDPNRLEQVFVNLWNNALKAIDDKGSVVISTGLNDEGKISIEFEDSGAGIPADIRHRIFDPFFTTRREGEGTGLGLSISYYIIKEMKGTLDFESLPGKGTTFTITLEKGRPENEEQITYAS